MSSYMEAQQGKNPLESETTPLRTDKGEKTPITPSSSTIGFGTFENFRPSNIVPIKVTSLKDEPFKLVRYDPDEITSYRAFGHIWTSIFVSWSVWKNMTLIIGLAVGTAIFSFITIPDPKAIDMTRMQDVANFFRVFIAFMLGLYVQSSYARYQTLILEYLSLFTCVKNTQSELMNLGVNDQVRKQIERYAVLSTRLLHTELKFVCESVIDRYDDWIARLQNLEERGYLMHDENAAMVDALHSAGFGARKGKKDVDLASLCWVWIGSLIAKLAQDNELPGLNTPTYNSLMASSKKAAQTNILQAKGCLSVQMPFPYSHMLATLVHVNNYILAVMSGITMGTAVGLFVHAFQASNYKGLGYPIQLMATQMIVVMVIPFFYQTFLQIAALMCSPVSNKEFPLPVEQLIERLETQLLLQAKFSDHPPSWEKPSWRIYSARQAVNNLTKK